MSNDYKIDITDGIKYLAEILNDNNYKLYIIGGYVRDAIINGHGDLSADTDVCGDCLPDDFVRITKGDSRINIKTTNYPLGTIKLFADGTELEYTCFRMESYRGDGYHTPHKVDFTDDIYQDALRRDFTTNSIYYNVLNEEFYDPFEGIKDIENKKIRCIRESVDVFSEDALRLLRMVRFAGRLGFDIDKKTMDGAIQTSHLIESISIERIGQELNKIIMTDYLGNAADAFFDSKLNEHVLPEVSKSTMLLLENAPKNINVRWAVFLHELSPKKAKEYIVNLCLGKNLGNDVKSIIEAMALGENGDDDIVVQFAKLGKALVEELLQVLEVLEYNSYEKLLIIFNDMVDNNQFIKFNDMAIDGNQIMDILHIEPRQIPKYKDVIFKFIVNEPKKNKYEDIKCYLLKGKVTYSDN